MTLIYFVLGLSLLIFIHELGHFLLAKIFHVYVYEFSLFMGPKIFQIKGKETKYSLRCIPIGGYCSMAGESDSQSKRNEEELEEENKEERIKVPFNRTLNGVSWIKKFLILLAGPFFNFILCFVLLFVYFIGTGLPDTSPRLTIVENSIAYNAGLRSEDIVKSIKGVADDGSSYSIEIVDEFNDISEVIDKIAPSNTDLNVKGKTQCLNFVVTRNGKEVKVSNVCRTIDSISISEDGLSVSEVFPKYGISQSRIDMPVGDALKNSALNEVNMAGLIYKALGELFKPGGLNNVSGVVGMYEASSSFASEGFFVYMFYLAMISVNLGIVNLLPLPALDGGRLLFMIIEKIRGKKLSTKVESTVNTIGILLLLALMVLVTIKDIFM